MTYKLCYFYNWRDYINKDVIILVKKNNKYIYIFGNLKYYHPSSSKSRLFFEQSNIDILFKKCIYNFTSANITNIYSIGKKSKNIINFSIKKIICQIIFKYKLDLDLRQIIYSFLPYYEKVL